MDLTVVLSIVIVALFAAGWTTLRRRPQPMPAQADMPTHPYHCVAVEARGGGCEAVRRMAGQRFLAAHAPALPLSGCNQSRCECIYLHYEDRRHHNRRDPYIHARRAPITELAQDRRVTSGRRKTDVLAQPVL